MIKKIILKLTKISTILGLLFATLVVNSQTATNVPNPVEESTKQTIPEVKKPKGLPTQTMPKRVKPDEMPSPLEGYAWRKAYDVDDGFDKEKIFNLYLDDLLYVNQIGHKAMPSERLDPVLEEKVELNQNYFKEQGEIASSTEQYAVAIKGKGFFKVQDLSDGAIYYTRNGNFVLNKETGELYTEDGYRLESATKISVDNTNIYIDENGKLFGDVYRSRESEELYQFELYEPSESASVEPFGSHFIFSEVLPVAISKPTTELILSSVELSTTKASIILARMLESLYAIDEKREQTIKENAEAIKNGNVAKEVANKDTKYQQSMVNFLMSEFSKAEGDITKLNRFANLVNELKLNLLFPKPNEESEG